MAIVKRLGSLATVVAAVLAVSCGGQSGLPQFEQAFGIVDSPCAVGVAATVAEQCTAHVLLVNKGGEGVGHVTLVVHMKDAKGAALDVFCGRSVPDTAGEGYSDQTCIFDQPVGSTIEGVPLVWHIDFTAAVAGGSSGFDVAGIGVVVLAVATLLLAGTVLLGMTRRDSPASDGAVEAPVASATTERQNAPPARDRTSSKRDDPDAEYKLPPLPR